MKYYLLLSIHLCYLGQIDLYYARTTRYWRLLRCWARIHLIPEGLKNGLLMHKSAKFDSSALSGRTRVEESFSNILTECSNPRLAASAATACSCRMATWSNSGAY